MRVSGGQGMILWTPGCAFPGPQAGKCAEAQVIWNGVSVEMAPTEMHFGSFFQKSDPPEAYRAFFHFVVVTAARNPSRPP